MERALETAEGDFELHVRDRGAPAVEFRAEPAQLDIPDGAGHLDRLLERWWLRA